MIQRRNRLPTKIIGPIFGGCFLLSGTEWPASAQMISSVSPSSGPSGTAVTLTGSGFGEAEESSTVTFNGDPAPIIRWTETQIAATVPDGATTGPVAVAVGEALSGSNRIFTSTSDSPFSLASITLPPEHPTLTVGLFKNQFTQRLRSGTVAAGVGHSCAVLSNGTLSCWGAGVSGQLGDGKAAGSSAPVTVNGIKSAAAVVWTSSDPSVATVDANGRAIALRPGLTTLSATSRGVSGSTTLLVESPAPPAAAPTLNAENVPRSR